MDQKGSQRRVVKSSRKLLNSKSEKLDQREWKVFKNECKETLEKTKKAGVSPSLKVPTDDRGADTCQE